MSLKKGEIDIAGIPTGLINTVNNKLDLTGGELSGDIKISNSTVLGFSKHNTTYDCTSGTPSSNIFNGSFRIEDKNSNWIGVCQSTHRTNNVVDMEIGVHRSIDGVAKDNWFKVGVDGDGKPWFDKPQIIKDYVNGTSGYRIWSNGYCEQWGEYSKSTGAATNITISLVKKYQDTNYNILALAKSNGSVTVNCYDLQMNPNTKVNNSFGIGMGSSSTYWFGFYWQTKGYLAVGQY